MTTPTAKLDTAKLRELCAPIVATCAEGDDCEHIECAFVVACERRAVERSNALPAALSRIEELETSVSLHSTRERQATEACTALTMENQRLRDLVALSKHLDVDIDGVLEDAEEAEVGLVQAQNEAGRLRAIAVEALELATHYVEHTLPISRSDADRRLSTLRASLAPEGRGE